MSVEFKSPVTSSNVNQAFLDKNKDTETQFKLALNRTGSGDPITDAQQAINDNATNLEAHEASYVAHREFDTKANLDTWATTADNGSFAFATDEKKSYQVIDGVLAEIGGGGGGISAWESATSYVIGNVVYYTDENIYRCIADNSDVTFTPANWQELSENPYVNNLTVTAQDNLTVTDSVGTRLFKSENYELYYQDFKDVLPSTIFSSTSASLTVNDVTGTEIDTSNTMASITQSGASPADSTEIVLPLPTKKQDWILTPIKILEMLEVTGGTGTFGVTLEQSSDGITFTALGSIPELSANVSLNKSIVQVNSDSTQIKIKFSVIVADDATTLNVHRILISTDAFPVGQMLKRNSVSLSGNDGRAITVDTEDVFFSGSGVGWSSSGDVHRYTPQRNGSVLFIKGEIESSTTPNNLSVDIYKNGTQYRRLSRKVGTSGTFSIEYTSYQGEFTTSDSISIRTDGNLTLVNNPVRHYLNIVEEAYADNVIVDAAVSGLNTINAGTLTISATTTAPTKGTVVTDKVWVVNNMNDTATIRFEFEQSSAGTAGSGDYLFKMPNGYKIDTTKVTPYTTVEGVGVYKSPNSVGYGSFTSPGDSGGGSIVVYSEDYVRIAGNHDANEGCVGNGYFSLDLTTISYSASFTVPIKGRSVDSLPISLDVSSERENGYDVYVSGATGLINQSRSTPSNNLTTSRTGTGTYQILIPKSDYPIEPSVLADAIEDSAGTNMTASLALIIKGTDTGSDWVYTVFTGQVNGALNERRDDNFNLRVRRVGADYRPPQAYIAGQVALTEARTDGVEYRANEKVDGQWVYARTIKWTGSSTLSSFDFITGMGDIKPISMVGTAKNNAGTWYHSDVGYSFALSKTATHSFRFSGAGDVWNEVYATIKYLK